MADPLVTYAAVGNIGGSHANTNFSQRVLMAPPGIRVRAVVPRGTAVPGRLPPGVTVVPARIPTLPGFYAHLLAYLVLGGGGRSSVVVTDRSAASIVGWALRGARSYRWAVDLWDVPHKELVTDYAGRPGLRGRLRRAASKAKVAALGFLLRRADIVVASVLPAALQRYRIDSSRLRPFQNAVDLEAIDTPDERAGPRRGVCYVTSRFVADRGLDVLVGAIERLESSDPPAIEVALAGLVGEAETQLIANSPVARRFRLLGQASLQDAHRLIAGSEIGLAPFRSNEDLDHTFPIKIYEYMALGAVVVAADLPGIRELLGEPPAGVLVPPGDPLALAEAISGLLASPERRSELREAGRRRVEAFDAREKTRRIYEALLGVELSRSVGA